MAQRRSFVTETNQNIARSKRTLNIIFVKVTRVLYRGCSDDDSHQERIRTGEINQIKNHPLVTPKVDPALLETLDKYDISAVLGFSNQAIDNLCRLCEENNAKIVIASAWACKKSLAQLQALFSISKFGRYIIDEIDDINDELVEKWLINHSSKVKSFVILKDNDADLAKQFNQRFVCCNKLFIDQSLVNRAREALNEPLDFEKSSSKLLLDAIERDSSSVSQVVFNSKNISALKIGFGCNSTTLMNRIFTALEKNTRITHLTLKDFYQQEVYLENQNEWTDRFLESIAAFLSRKVVKIEYLNLARNSLSNLNRIIVALDGFTLHIPHLCFDANPIEIDQQMLLAEWMARYPLPIRIDLDLSGSGFGCYPIDSCIINAVNQNKNIQLFTEMNFSASSSPIEQGLLAKLIDEGRIVTTKKYENTYSMR